MSKKNNNFSKETMNSPLETEEESLQGSEFSVEEERDTDDVFVRPILQKIGLFSVNWVEALPISAHGSEKIFRSIHAGTIIYDQEEIERLRIAKAPIKVYIEYVDESAKS